MEKASKKRETRKVNTSKQVSNIDILYEGGSVRGPKQITFSIYDQMSNFDGN